METTRDHILTHFGAIVRQQRVALGISQEELGYRSNLDRTYVSGIERGKRNPTLTAMVSIAKGLNLPLGALLMQMPLEEGRDSDE